MVHIGELRDSTLVAYPLAPNRRILCASPAYAARHGLPGSVEEIPDHQCVNFLFASGRVYEWEFKVGGQLRKVAPPAMLTFNDADLVLQSVLDGHGIAQMAGYQVCDHLRAGTLVACLPQYAPHDRGHYLIFLSREHLPARVRVFIDYMTEGIRARDLQILESLLPKQA
ncbi:hypothetical protein G6F65_014229 [Rhizopus arrhizus]|nr:hypothetical protein G6F65_014229 [Rhizopus arrhizus]